MNAITPIAAERAVPGSVVPTPTQISLNESHRARRALWAKLAEQSRRERERAIRIRKMVSHAPAPFPSTALFHQKSVPFDFYATPGPRHIIALVALKHGMVVDELVGPGRSKPVVAARYEAIYLVHTHMNISSTRLGRAFNRDHKTALDAVLAYQKRSGINA